MLLRPGKSSQWGLLIRPPAMTSTERVRAFRERNPGYDRRYMARRRAMEKAGAARILAEMAAASEAAATAAVAEPVALPAPVKPMLMLPAPVQDPAMEALNALAASLKARAAATPVASPVRRSNAA